LVISDHTPPEINNPSKKKGILKSRKRPKNQNQNETMEQNRREEDF
jgi:hypothetical protein